MDVSNIDNVRLMNLPKPKPSAGLEAYNRELELALAFCDKRRNNYQLYLANKHERSLKVQYLPIKLDIENVSRCNFKCTMCQVSDWHKGMRANDLNLSAFKSIIDEQYGLVEIKLQGMGEPLLQGDEYIEMIKYARSKYIWVRTTTNASLLHLKDNYKKLVDCDANEIQISIDGATKKTFEAIRRQSNFDRVKKNCLLINEYLKKKSLRRTKMWVVLQNSNIHEMESLFELAVELGFNDLVYSLDLNFWGQTQWQEKMQSVASSNEIDVDLCEKLVQRGKTLGIDVSYWVIGNKFNSDKKDNVCFWPWERAYISSDQKVVPCCMVANPDISNLGPLNLFLDNWREGTFSEFRQRHLSGDIPNECKHCYKFAGNLVDAPKI